MSAADRPHRPVLPAALLRVFETRGEGWYVDGTLGAGGHAEAFLERTPGGTRLLGIDRDRDALDHATGRLARFGDRFVPAHGRHEDLAAILDAHGIDRLRGVWLDLGVSSLQLDRGERGFSWRFDAPLDMRMDRSRGVTAAEWIADADEDTLRRTIRRWGEEPRARAIAAAIVERRERTPIVRTVDLAELVAAVAGRKGPKPRTHPATRTFQAIRIAVNDEISGLGETLERAIDAVVPGGALGVIAFHSLEDRVVKRTFRELANRCTCPPDLPVCGCGREDRVRILTPRAIRPDAGEIADNPRARSARLRAVEVLP